MTNFAAALTVLCTHFCLSNNLVIIFLVPVKFTDYNAAIKYLFNFLIISLYLKVISLTVTIVLPPLSNPNLIM